MTSRLRPLFLAAGLATLAGCDESEYAGPILYRDSERMARDLADKPQVQGAVRKILADQFGPDVRHIKVPANSGLRGGGIYLADRRRAGDKVEPVLDVSAATGRPEPIEGGYALYRRHCLHCHGVGGGGDGPTAPTMFPRPRDYRPGIYKFTSTNPVDAKPSRDDLRKTLLYGLHGTSMPGFEATMRPDEIEQVIDYMTFLSIRGETERYLIDEAMNVDEKDAATGIDAETVAGIVSKVTTSWTDAEANVVNPSTRRVAPDRASVLRGRDLYLGAHPTVKLECTSCHGTGGLGNGPAFVERDIFDDVVFREWSLDAAIGRYYRADRDRSAGHDGPTPAARDPKGLAPFLAENAPVVAALRKGHGLMADLAEPAFAEKAKAEPETVAAAARALLPDLDDPAFRAFLVAKLDLWGRSVDVWENPLRPANLVEGTYKGGRRPIDLYWRLAKGINGAKMPSHSNILTDDQIWDVVNFVLALPGEPELLKDAAPKPIAPAAPHTASR